MDEKLEKRPINQIRRNDRAKDDDWIRSLLHESAYGTLATVDGDQPFTNINLYAYDESKNSLYFHTANVGRTRHNIEKNPKVCFTAGDMGRLLPADEAIEVSVEYRSVMVFGEMTIVEDHDEALYGLMLLMKKYFPALEPGTDYQGISENDLKRTTVYRFDIEQWSGKEKRAPEDFPDAFRFEDRFDQ